MKSFVLEKTRYLLTNSWFGLLIPAGVHQLLNIADKSPAANPEKSLSAYRAHPAESRMTRQTPSTTRP